MSPVRSQWTLSFAHRFAGPVAFDRLEVPHKRQPGRLLTVIKLAWAALVVVEDVVKALESQFEHGRWGFLGPAYEGPASAGATVASVSGSRLKAVRTEFVAAEGVGG